MDVAKKTVKLVQVKTEPGLTTAEMMLTNDDLRPGEYFLLLLLLLLSKSGVADGCQVEPERRQWGWLNFVAFWIADSLNVVSLQNP